MGCRKLTFALFLSALVLAGFIPSCHRHRFAEGIVTSNPTSVGSDWVNIPIADPLVAKWDSVMILVNVNSSLKATYNPLGIRLDDGSIAVPEAELITTAGQRQPLHLFSFDDAGGIYFSSEQIASGRRFSALRIRSPKVLNCFLITWTSYMRKDCAPDCKFARVSLARQQRTEH